MNIKITLANLQICLSNIVSQRPKMIFSTCCGCIPLRIGAIIISILEMQGGFAIFGALGFIYNWSSLGWIDILTGIVSAAAGAYLFVGATKFNTTAMIIHLMFSLIATGFYSYLAFLNGHQARNQGLFHHSSFFIAYLITSLTKFYFLLISLSFYQSLRSHEITSSA